MQKRRMIITLSLAVLLLSCEQHLTTAASSKSKASSIASKQENMQQHHQDDGCVFNLELPKPKVIAFWQQIKEGLTSNQKEQVMALIQYPLLVNSISLNATTLPDGSNRSELPTVKTRAYDRKEIDVNYSQLFTKKLIEKIKNADVNDVFCNYKGTMIAHGLLWAYPNQEGHLRITVLNQSEQ